VLDYFGDAKVLGVTATPDRADEKAMGQVFDSVAFLYEIEDAINDGYLCDVRCSRIEIAGLDLSNVKTTAGDLNQGDLDAVMAIEEVLLGVADATIREAGKRKTLLFTTSVANADKLAEILNRHRDGCARAVNGKTEIDERRGILKAHQAGDYQFLCNVGIATEGYDDPSISCVAIARPTKSRALYTQMCGRGLRIFDGKPDCLLIDYVGNSGRHKLASALDVLGGRYTEEEEELAQKIVEKNPGMKARDAIDEAHAQAEREKAELEKIARLKAIKAKAIYSKQDVNPFGIFHLDVQREQELAERFGGKIASDKQIACLQKFKIPVPAGCTSQLASKLIGTAITRRQKDLASFGQLKTLQKYGVNDINISFKHASTVIDAIAQNQWRPLPFANLDAIMGSGSGDDF
jgi:superfamily II DNA or RNA helicase